MSSSESIPQIVPTGNTGNITIAGRQIPKKWALLVVGLIIVAVLYWYYRRRESQNQIADLEEVDMPESAQGYNL